jgi:hypothetical protein
LIVRRTLNITIRLFALVAVLALSCFLRSESTEYRRAEAQAVKGAVAYTGAGSCTSSNCHGSVWPRTGIRIKQNEYKIWSTKDKHARAYNVLLEARSKLIARNLGIARPETANKCLDCHALNVPKSEQAKSFDLSDGVSCESCHGPAAAWLGPHTTRGQTHAQNVALGMYDTKDLPRRTERCLSCHIGNEKKTVDHEMIAAGHPDLTFELDTFSALMPQHWDEAKGAWQGMRRWAVGQAVALRTSIDQLARRARGNSWNGWPDFADFECFSCHHNLVLPSARQARGYQGRAGIPPWNPSRYVVFRQVVAAISPSEGQALDQLITELKQHLQNAESERTSVVEAALRVAQLMDRLAPQLEKAAYSELLARSVMRAIAGDGNAISNAGIRSAEQATMALDALYNSYEQTTGNSNKALNTQISRLYDALQSTSRYDPEQFAAQLRQVRNLLP